MHAAVSTFQMGKPAICLSYSKKYNGVIAEGLKMKELVIEAKGDKIWNDKIEDKVMEKLNYIDKNYELVVDKIKENVNESKEKILNTITEIANEIKEK